MENRDVEMCEREELIKIVERLIALTPFSVGYSLDLGMAQLAVLQEDAKRVMEGIKR